MEDDSVQIVWYRYADINAQDKNQCLRTKVVKLDPDQKDKDQIVSFQEGFNIRDVFLNFDPNYVNTHLGQKG